MTRRTFLKQSIGGGALLSVATPTIAQSVTTLRLLTTDQLSADALSGVINDVADGSMVVETTLVPMSEAGNMLDRIANGEADMCLESLDRFLTKNLAFGLFASMPFGMSAGEMTGWMQASDGAEMLESLGQKTDTKFFFAGDTGTKPMWSKQPLSDVASLQGAAIGSSGLGAANLQQLGVQSVADIHDPSVDLGGLDAIDGMTVVAMQEGGLLDAFPHVSLTNPNTPSGIITLGISNSAFAALDESEQLILERSCSAAMALGRAKAFHDNATALAALGDSVTVADMPDDIWQGLRDSAQELLTTIFEEGDAQATVVDAYIYFLTDIAGWSEIGEAAFFTGRKRISNS